MTNIHPALALAVFLAATLLTLVLFWPRKGVIARVLRVLRMTERVRIEDALKHLYHGEAEHRPCTVESLAGTLEISRGRAVALLGRLETLGLARADGAGLPLTEEGRSYALRVLRTHRLWERYLADRTGVAPADWHDEAEVQEHLLTSEETETLAARMGQPLFDPHGDPIPTATGELPVVEGVVLTGLRPGQLAGIVHLEDEPREVFDRLSAAGLSPGMQVRVLPGTPGRVRFRAAGADHDLASIEANNVTVVPLPETADDRTRLATLATLAEGDTGVVVQLAPACQGPARRRLLDLGVVPGTHITAALVSAAGDPVAYRIRGALIALRREQAEWIQIDHDLAKAAS